MTTRKPTVADAVLGAIDRALDGEKCFECHSVLNKPDGTSRVIGNEIWGVYDGVLYWSCPDCGYAWVRVFGYPARDELSEKYALIHNQNRKETGHAAENIGE